MTDPREELVRGIYARWAEGDFRAGVEHYASDFVLVQGRDFPEAGVYRGLDGVARYMASFLEAWERVTIAAEAVETAGDHVLVSVYQRGSGTGSGAITDFRYVHVWTFRGDEVVRLENFRDLALARAAASG